MPSSLHALSDPGVRILRHAVGQYGVESVLAQHLDERVDGPELLPPDFGVVADVVAETLHRAGPQLLAPGEQLVTRGIRPVG
jgi:hypothetical protein